MLMHIPSIGRKTAVKLLYHLGTLRTIATASKKELRKAWLGKRRIKNTEEIFTTTFDSNCYK